MDGLSGPAQVPRNTDSQQNAANCPVRRQDFTACLAADRLNLTLEP
jgi:hypothetical protein